MFPSYVANAFIGIHKLKWIRKRIKVLRFIFVNYLNNTLCLHLSEQSVLAGAIFINTNLALNSSGVVVGWT